MYLLCITGTASKDELSFGACLPCLHSPPTSSYVSPLVSSWIPARGPAFHLISLSFAWCGSPRPAPETSGTSDLKVESGCRFPTFRALALGSSGWNPLAMSKAIDLVQHWPPTLFFLLGIRQQNLLSLPLCCSPSLDHVLTHWTGGSSILSPVSLSPAHSPCWLTRWPCSHQTNVYWGPAACQGSWGSEVGKTSSAPALEWLTVE